LHSYSVNSRRINDMQLDNESRLSRDEWIFMLMSFGFLFLVLYLDL